MTGSDDEKPVCEVKGGVQLRLRVTPRASRTEVIGLAGGVVKVKIHSAPVDGAANNELVKCLSRYFGRPKSDITIVSGLKSKNKTMQIAGVDLAYVVARLGMLNL